VEAVLEVVAALSDAGRSAEIDPYRRLLGDLLETVQYPQARGRIAWAAGNADLRMGRVDSGLELHETAAEYLTAEADFGLWARFNLASAAERLDAGLADDKTLLLLENAAHGYAVIKTPGADVKLALYSATYASLHGQWAEALVVLEERAARATELGDATLTSKYAILMAQCLSALGKSTEASASVSSD
jgi:hypothetical protein